jgi:putative DNA-invertase from lambdoid prophage Rac
MIYGYIRVSTKEQDANKQKFEILNYAHCRGLKADEIVEETVSSIISYKSRLLGHLIEKVKKDDIVITTELSRFGRSLMEVMEILNQLMQKEVKVYVTKGNMELGENIQSKVLAFAFSLAAEIERELISSRTKEALAKVKSEGKRLGRPKGSLSKSKLDGKEDTIDLYLLKGISVSSICKLLDVAPTTFYSFCRNRGIDTKKYKKPNLKGDVPLNV